MRRTSCVPVLCLLAVGVVAPGCTSFSTLQRARVIEPGTSRWGASLQGLAIQGDDIGITVPVVEGSYRRGLTDTVDVGAKVWPIGVLVDAKVQYITRPRFAASVAPGLAFSSIGLLQKLEAHLPFLFGLDYGSSELTFGGKLIASLALVTGTAEDGTEGEVVGAGFEIFPGFMVGFDWALSKSFHIMPEVNIHFSTLGGSPLFFSIGDTAQVQFALSVFIQ